MLLEREYLEHFASLTMLEQWGKPCMRLAKLRRKLKTSYGAKPDIHYFDGDMRGISTYFQYRHENLLDDFLIDDITWNDLSGDDLYKRINHGLSTPGEQYLYYLLRSPAIEHEEYDKRANLVEMMENNPELRLKLQVILARLGKRRGANYCEVFTPSTHSLKKAFLYILLVFALFASAIISFAITKEALALFICLVVFLPIFHSRTIAKIETEISTVNYSVSMVCTVKKIGKQNWWDWKD